MTADDFGDEGLDPVAGGDAILVRRKGRVVQHVRPVEVLAKAPPVIVAGDADEHLVAVGGVVGLVNGPGAPANRPGRDLMAREDRTRVVRGKSESDWVYPGGGARNHKIH